MPIYKIPGKRDGYQKYRIVVNYTDNTGKKKTKEKYAYGKAAAENAERELFSKINGGGKESASEILVTDLLKLYEEKRGSEIRETTLRKKRGIFKHHIEPYFQKITLQALTSEKISDWRDWLGSKDMKVGTKNNAIRELHAYLNFAIQIKLIPNNPMTIKQFRDPYRVPDSETIRYYTKDEFQKYIAEAKKWAEKRNDLQAWGIYTFFNLAYYTGMRKGEINALRWSDIENTSTIWVRRSISQKIKGSRITETPPKNESSVRRLQMPTPLITVLDEHRERQMKDKKWNVEYRICGGPDVIPDTTLEKANQLFAETASIKKITIHEFRHSHASLLCNAGINIKEIARRMGHSDVNMTWKTYSHLYPAEEEKAIAILNTI